MRAARSPDCSACCCRRGYSSCTSCRRRVTSATRWRARRQGLRHLLPAGLGAGHLGARAWSAMSCCALISRCRFSISCWRASRPALLGIGRVEAHAVRVDQGGRPGPRRRCRRAAGRAASAAWKVGAGVDVAQPVVEQRAQVGIGDAQQARQRREALRRGRRGRGRAAAGRRPGARAARRSPKARAQSRLRTSSAAMRSRSTASSGGLPAGLDVQLLPQARQAGQLMLGQPGFERALLLHVFLQVDEGEQAGLQASQGLRVVLGGRLRAAALGVGLGHAAFELGQLGLRGLELVLPGGAVAGRACQAGRVGGVPVRAGPAAGARGAAPGSGSGGRRRAASARQQGEVLLDLGQRGAHLIAPGGRVAHAGLDGRQTRHARPRA